MSREKKGRTNGRHSVLVVDDEPGFRKSLSVLLGDEYDVVTAADGREGLEVLRNKPVSLILLDLDMPVMNGVEMLKSVRDGSSDTKVIVMTGRSSHGWAKRCADLNVQGYVEKPFEIDELTGRMKQVLGPSKSAAKTRQEKEMVLTDRLADASPLVREIISYIQSRGRENFTNEEIAAHFNRSVSFVSRRFQTETGLTLKTYTNRCRIERAIALLEAEPTLRIRDVAETVGIPDSNYFSRLFTRVTGESPVRYRTRLKGGTAKKRRASPRKG